MIRLIVPLVVELVLNAVNSGVPLRPRVMPSGLRCVKPISLRVIPNYRRSSLFEQALENGVFEVVELRFLRTERLGAIMLAAFVGGRCTVSAAFGCIVDRLNC